MFVLLAASMSFLYRTLEALKRLYLLSFYPEIVCFKEADNLYCCMNENTHIGEWNEATGRYLFESLIKKHRGLLVWKGIIYHVCCVSLEQKNDDSNQSERLVSTDREPSTVGGCLKQVLDVLIVISHKVHYSHHRKTSYEPKIAE